MLYRAGDLDTLVAKSSELIVNAEMRQQMGVEAREKSCQKHSWEANARAIIKLIEESLNV